MLKKSVFLISILFAGFPFPALASKGYAADGLIFMLGIAGFVLVVAGIFYGIDYTRKNGRRMILQARIGVRRIHAWLRQAYRKTKTEHLDLAHLGDA